MREPYGEAFREGDVVGCLLHMPEGGRSFEVERKDILGYKNGSFLAVVDSKETPKQLPGSFIGFSLNGRWGAFPVRFLFDPVQIPRKRIGAQTCKQAWTSENQLTQ